MNETNVAATVIDLFAEHVLIRATTVMFLSFQTGRSGQTVKTQISKLLEKQSDQGLHCLPFCLYLLD